MMVVDIKKLKDKIEQNKFSNESFSKQIGIDQSTLYRKLKNNGEPFLIREVYAIIDTLKLDELEVTEIFFSKNSHLR